MFHYIVLINHHRCKGAIIISGKGAKDLEEGGERNQEPSDVGERNQATFDMGGGGGDKINLSVEAKKLLSNVQVHHYQIIFYK